MCLFPMASAKAESNVTNDRLLKNWCPWGGLYMVSNSKSSCSCGKAREKGLFVVVKTTVSHTAPFPR